MPADPSPGRKTAHRNAALDGLRGLAVLLVFLFHYGGGLHSSGQIVHLLGLITEAGWVGVVMFFAFSGFLITGSLWDTLTSVQASGRLHVVRNFFARRALRILPIYYATLALVTVFSLARGATFTELRPFAIFACFLQDIPAFAVRALTNPSPFPLYHFWSLAIEEQFYLVWPWLLLLAVRSPAALGRNRAIAICVGVILIAMLFCTVAYSAGALSSGIPFRNALRMSLSNTHPWDEFLLTQAGALGAGSALALLLRGPSAPVVERWAWPAVGAGVAAFLASSLACHSFYLEPGLQFIVGLPGVTLAATAAIAIVLRRGPVRWMLTFPPLCQTGRLSYGFYVYQVLLQPVFRRLTVQLLHVNHGDLYFGTRFVIALAGSLLVAWVSFHLIEMPFLRWKRRFPLLPPLTEVPLQV